MDLFSYLLGKKAGSRNATKVIANPELTGTEDDLTGLQVGDTKYKVQNLDISWATMVNPVSYDWTLPNTHNYTKVPLEIARQKADNFSISDNEIIVNKDFSIVAVSLKIPVYTTSTSESRYILFELIRNGASISNGGAMTETYCVGSRTTTVIIPMTMTALKANDHIVVKLYGQNGDKLYRGNLQMNIIGINE